MRIVSLLAAAFALAAASAASAQGVTAPKALTAPPPATTAPKTPAPQAAAPAAKREPTAGQMAARERQKKCGAEWKEAKAAGKTDGQKWPQFWSRCNARLKGSAT